MVHPLAKPFTSRRPSARVNHIRSSTFNKRLRLYNLFPLCLRTRTLNNAQCAAFRLRRKPLAGRLRQLKELQAYREDVERKISDLQGRMVTLAQTTAIMVHSISFVDPRPPRHNPFDGRAYWWNWKGIKMRIMGCSSRHFHITFDFSTYTSDGYVEVLVP